MAKSINGEGSIRQRKSGKLAGKWRVQWAYTDPLTNEYVQVDKTFSLQKDASEYLGTLKARVRTGQLISDANAKKALTLATWFDDLAGTEENSYKGRWAIYGELDEKTIGNRVCRFNNYVRESRIGRMPIKSITTDTAREFFRELSLKGEIGPHALVALRKDLVKTVNDAIDTYDKLPNLANPFGKVKVKTPDLRDGVVLSPAEIKAGLARLDDVEDRAQLGLYLLGGLRPGEQIALCQEQIDLERGIILIDRAVHRTTSGRLYLGLPKGKKIRIATMCPSLANLLRPFIGSTTQHLFPDKDSDSPYTLDAMEKAWERIKATAKLPQEMTPRDGRLSHNTCIEKLMPLVSTSTRLEHMGHGASAAAGPKGIVVNLKNYTRFLDEAQDILRNELERVFGFNDISFLQVAEK